MVRYSIIPIIAQYLDLFCCAEAPIIIGGVSYEPLTI